MPNYSWRGTGRGRAAVSGDRVADSAEALRSALRREGIDVTSLKEKRSLFSGATVKKVPPKDLAIFTRQFSVMLDAGLPLVQCLEILGGANENKGFAQILNQTRVDIEGGASLADAMRKHPKAFDELYCNMIAAGESGGILDDILKRLSTYIEKAVKLRAQIKGAMMYPIAVVGIAALVITVILWKVIPTFAAMFAGLGAALPLPTRIVIAMSNWLVRLLLPGIVAGGLLVFAFRRYYASYKGRRAIDGLLLKLPILGVNIRKVAVAKFCRTLATLISSGVPILDGLKITATTAGNAVVEDTIMKVRKSVESGTTISQPLKESAVFPAMVVQMIGVGEQTGAMDAMLSKIADFYEDEVDQAVADMLALMEPVIILFLGVTVGGIVIAMYLPLFSLIGQLA